MAALLEPMVVTPRLDRLRQAVAGESALLVTNLTNIRYLTGFTGSAGMLFVLPDQTVLVTDGRYEEQAAAQVNAAGADVSVRVAPAPGQRGLAEEIVKGSRVTALALEAAHISWARQRALAEWFPGIELIASEGMIEGLRRIKDDAELARLAAAAGIADEALALVLDGLGDRPTEAAFGRHLDQTMRELGASAPSFETIVASGPNAARPHHRPSDRAIGAGETVVIDFGARVDGYCSDMTRTVSVGDLTDRDLRRVLDVVTEAQAAGVEAVRSGVAACDVDAACRDVVAAAGYGDRFVHGTGHGVGLDIHEAPAVSSASTDTLETGQVITVEPGIYLPGIGGVRVEDTVVVTPSGCRPLTLFPKDLR